MKDKIRIAMVGAGNLANAVHYPSLASFDDVVLTAVCDLNPKALQETADKYRIDCRYSDYRKMIEETAPDGVYVIGPPHHMFDIWLWCLKQKQNLFIEKPMGLTLHQAEMLTHLAQTSSCITQVGHQRRSCPLLVEMRKRVIERGGPIVHAVCEFYKHFPGASIDAWGHMMGDCTHAIDTVRWMCGGEVVGIECQCKRVGTPDINWIAATLHFDTGATGFVHSSWCTGRRVFRVEMHAPNVYCDAEPEGTARLYADGDYEGIEFDTRQVAGSDEFFVYAGFRAKNREFIDSLKTGTSVCSSPFSDCVKTVRVAQTILAQDTLSPR